MKLIKELVNKIKSKVTVESWTLFLLVVGLPVVGLVYVDWKLSLAIFCIVNIIIGILYLRNNK